MVLPAFPSSGRADLSVRFILLALLKQLLPAISRLTHIKGLRNFLISVRKYFPLSLLAFLLTNAVYGQDVSWKDRVVFENQSLSVDVSRVLVGELLREIGRKTKVKISGGATSAALAKQRITVNFIGLTPEQGIALIITSNLKVSSSGLLRITGNKRLFSVQADDVNIEKVMKALSDVSGSDIRFLSPDDQDIKVNVFIENQAIQNAINKIMESLPYGGYASVDGVRGKKKSFYVTSRKGTNSLSAIAMKGQKNKGTPLPEVKDIPSLVNFINQVGSRDADCEQTYFALAALGLGTKSWWQTAGKIPTLIETAKNPKVATCARMASLELYISKLSKEELQNILPDLQSYFGETSVPDKLVARLMQLLAERDVAPTQLIETILESDARGQTARVHAWYAAGRTQTYSPHLLDMAMQDAAAAGATQSVSGKMALEYMSNLPQSSVGAAVESKVSVSVVQAVNSAIALPSDTGLNELGRSMAAVSAIPRFLPKAEVVPYLDQVITKAANDDVKLAAIDVLLSIQTDYATEVAAQAQKISGNLETIFTDAVSRERANARLKKLGHK